MTRLPLALALLLGLAACDATAPSDPAAPVAVTADGALTDAARSAVVLVGVVQAERGRWRTVAGTDVVTGRTTRIETASGFVATPADAGLGAGVEVRGRLRADGTVRARSVFIWAPEAGDAKAVEGTIEEIDDGRLVVDGTAFVTDALTRWMGPDGEPLAPSMFSKGDRVSAGGHVRDGALHADVVKLDR